MDRTKRLLSRGYLPSQLPPAFTTEDLANNHLALYAGDSGAFVTGLSHLLELAGLPLLAGDRSTKRNM